MRWQRANRKRRDLGWGRDVPEAEDAGAEGARGSVRKQPMGERGPKCVRAWRLREPGTRTRVRGWKATPGSCWGTLCGWKTPEPRVRPNGPLEGRVQFGPLPGPSSITHGAPAVGASAPHVPCSPSPPRHLFIWGDVYRKVNI